MTAPRDGAGPPADVLEARTRAELVVGAADVDAAVDRLAVRLTLAFAEADPLMLVVMHGGLPFAGALLQRCDFPMQVAYAHVSRFRDATRGGELRWHARTDVALEGRTVLVVDDVLDHGDTLAALLDWCSGQGVREAVSVVLVDKQGSVSRPVSADYAALSCPDRYLFGYGMDYRGYWRNLPAIYALPEDMERRS